MTHPRNAQTDSTTLDQIMELLIHDGQDDGHGVVRGNWTMYDGSVQALRLLETLDPECYWLEVPPKPGTYADYGYLVAEVYR